MLVQDDMDDEVEQKLIDFVNNQQDVPPEFIELIDDYFWDLI